MCMYSTPAQSFPDHAEQRKHCQEQLSNQIQQMLLKMQVQTGVECLLSPVHHTCPIFCATMAETDQPTAIAGTRAPLCLPTSPCREAATPFHCNGRQTRNENLVTFCMETDAYLQKCSDLFMKLEGPEPEVKISASFQINYTCDHTHSCEITITSTPAISIPNI